MQMKLKNLMEVIIEDSVSDTFSNLVSAKENKSMKMNYMFKSLPTTETLTLIKSNFISGMKEFSMF